MVESAEQQTPQVAMTYVRRQQAFPFEVAHDVRHCAATIILLTAALADEIGDGVSSRSALDGITNCARTIAALCDDRSATSSTRVDVVAEYLVAQTRLIHSGPVALVAAPAETSASQIDVVRIVANLVDNARAAAGEDGSLSVEVSANDGTVVIEVGDSGHGFSDTTSTPAGLGLSIVATLAEKLRGTVTLGRSPLGGALVVVEFPRHPWNGVALVTDHDGAT